MLSTRNSWSTNTNNNLGNQGILQTKSTNFSTLYSLGRKGCHRPHVPDNMTICVLMCASSRICKRLYLKYIETPFQTVQLFGVNSGITKKGCTWLHLFVHFRSGWTGWLRPGLATTLCRSDRRDFWDSGCSICVSQPEKGCMVSMVCIYWSTFVFTFEPLSKVKSFRPASPAYCARIGGLNETKTWVKWLTWPRWPSHLHRICIEISHLIIWLVML